jgi:hypothetical protein
LTFANAATSPTNLFTVSDQIPWQCPARPLTIDGMGAVLAYIAAAVVAVWGLAHVIPTRQVVAGFGAISADNRRVITQEWLAEAIMMWGIAAFVIAITAATGASDVRAWVYRVGAGSLVAVGILTGLTGARTRVVWFKICPLVMAVGAGLLLTASVV